MDWLEPRRYAAELEVETDRLAGAVGRLSPAAVVPTCPDWTVRDLVAHVGTGHRYATGVIERAATAPVPFEALRAPEDPGDWPGWLAAGARGLVEAVGKHGFDSPVWTFIPAHRIAGFWLRRMVHDEIIHRFDADPAGDLAADLAADGIADLLTVFATVTGPAAADPRRRQLTGAGETLLLRATDTGGRWLVTLHGGGMRWEEAEAEADVVYQGPVLDLLLVVNRRRPPAADRVHGDRQLLDRWLDLIRF
ncbi:maleylpyruvate isomerase family mycothiol-dependent enzyme [Actinoplanes philippinensis]|uniref:maleylpyruvate isomerase family mycothiol-dependent enzyme n=1 Tax=Actinoplanes philippinensis TaxID=35752 RepID=UPI0033C56B04